MKAPRGRAGGLVRAGHLVLGRAEDRVPAADLAGQVDDRHDDHQVDQRVLDERDHGGSPQARGVGEGGEHRERDEQWRVLGEPVVATTDARDLQHRLDADQLQRDVGHRRDEPGDRDRQGESAGVVPAPDEVGRGDEPVPVADRPEPGHEEEDDRVEDDRVGDREEPCDRAGREHRRRNRHERVRRVEVAAEQEPGHPRPELATSQAPLVEGVEAVSPAEPGGHEAEDRDQQEQRGQDDEGDGVDVGGQRHQLGGHRRSSSPSSRLPRRADRVSR